MKRKERCLYKKLKKATEAEWAKQLLSGKRHNIKCIR